MSRARQNTSQEKAGQNPKLTAAIVGENALVKCPCSAYHDHDGNCWKSTQYGKYTLLGPYTLRESALPV